MKIGVRKPSLKRSIKARTTGRVTRSIKRVTNPFYGKKGTGFIKSPKRVIYNKVYNKTTVSAFPKGYKGSSVSKSSSQETSNLIPGMTREQELRYYQLVGTPFMDEINSPKYTNGYIAFWIVLGFFLLVPWIYAWYLLRKRKQLRQDLWLYLDGEKEL